MTSNYKYPDVCFVLNVIPYPGDTLERTYENMYAYLNECFEGQIVGYDLLNSQIRIINKNLYEMQLILSNIDIDECMKLVEKYINCLVSYNEIVDAKIVNIERCNCIWENGKVI